MVHTNSHDAKLVYIYLKQIYLIKPNYSHIPNGRVRRENGNYANNISMIHYIVLFCESIFCYEKCFVLEKTFKFPNMLFLQCHFMVFVIISATLHSHTGNINSQADRMSRYANLCNLISCSPRQTEHGVFYCLREYHAGQNYPF